MIVNDIISSKSACLPLNPLPTPPKTFSAGIGQSSKYTSAVLEHLIPIFFSGGP